MFPELDTCLVLCWLWAKLLLATSGILEQVTFYYVDFCFCFCNSAGEGEAGFLVPLLEKQQVKITAHKPRFVQIVNFTFF